MKISRGKLKGRNLFCLSGVRPVSELVRKACFNIFSQAIDGTRVLDLFAGTGALGIEALSMGATEAVFVDIDYRCVESLRKSLSDFGLSNESQVHCLDAEQAIPLFARQNEQFDLIFLDPPYYKGMLRKTLQALEEYDIVRPLGYLVGFCYKRDEILENTGKFNLIRDRNYGQTRLLIYQKP